ncbi:peptidoglycan recognition protein family protein [Lysinibacillus sp. KU-BSD001]|uniref:peptidoglycan recognition protein family protein n=1 Tax=Lysinibacillus sp. KU-BSD001 TaxID=3141328 RepID=UPI0036F23E53
MSYVFKQVFLSSSKHKLKSPYSMTPQFITVHNTANDAPAANEVAYHNRNDDQVSYHVAIDDKEVIQCIPFNRNAWHCGDGANGTGNRKSIGIEICYSKSGGECYKQAEENAVQYIAKLLYQYGWGIDRIKKHKDWSGKYCPHRILAEDRWDSFKNRIQVELDKLKNPKKVAISGELTLNVTAQKELHSNRDKLKKLIAGAYKEGVFTSDHTSKVDFYTDDELASYALIYAIRKVE